MSAVDASQAVRAAVISYAETQAHFDIAPLVEPIEIRGPYALADWTAGRKSGEVLLVRANGTWTVIVLQNSSLLDANYLHLRYHVPPDDAAALVKALSAAEKAY